DCSGRLRTARNHHAARSALGPVASRNRAARTACAQFPGNAAAVCAGAAQHPLPRTVAGAVCRPRRFCTAAEAAAAATALSAESVRGDRTAAAAALWQRTLALLAGAAAGLTAPVS